MSYFRLHDKRFNRANQAFKKAGTKESEFKYIRAQVKALDAYKNGFKH